MIDPVILICAAAAFLITFLMVPKWAKKVMNMKLVGRDMNKQDRPEVPEAGGVTVIAGTVTGLLVYIFMYTFYFNSDFGLVEILAVLATILMAGFVGFIDDILGWKVGMRHSTKILSTVPIAIPLVVVNAGDAIMNIPFVGFFDFGFMFPLLIVPLGIIGAINGYNMLAGYNGLEAGMGIIILGTLGLIAWISGAGWVSMISLIMMSSLAAFFWFNKFPSKIFPGDSLTYSVGAIIACIAILGNMEKYAILLFIPYFFDAFMFIRFRFIDKVKDVEAFAKVGKNGCLEMPHEKIYDFTHLIIVGLKKVKENVYEKDVVYTTFAFQLCLSMIVLWLWNLGL